MTALIIGRFQPLHLGHLQLIIRAVRENEKLLIGIGSSDENYRQANPFTCSERIRMLEAALKDADVPNEKYSIIPIPNINNFALWAQHVELYVPPFQKLYTGSGVVMKLYDEYNRKLKEPYEIVPVHKEIPVSSTDIRERMLRRRKWEHLVPEAVATLINEWQGVERLIAVQEEQK